MYDTSTYAGQAALTLVEALILHLRDAQHLSAEDVGEIFHDAIDAHRAADVRFDGEDEKVARLLEDVATGCSGEKAEIDARPVRPAPLQPRQRPAEGVDLAKAGQVVRHLEDVLAHAAEAGMAFTMYRLEMALETARGEAERGEAESE